VFSFLSQKIIYTYNDTVLSLVRGYESMSGVALLPPSTTAENARLVSILITKITDYLFSLADPILVSNILAIAFFSLLIVFSFILFRDLISDKALAFVFATVYSTSPYFLYRVSSLTISLYPVFVFPILICFLVKKRNVFYLLALVITTFLLSSYYGLFALILTVFWKGIELSLDKEFKKLLAFLASFLLPIGVFLALTYSTVIIDNIPLLGSYSKSRTAPTEQTTFYRPLENWYNFSFRPWYLVIPPKSSLLFKDLAVNAYDSIESTGYYLADDYAVEEMAGSYLGWHFLLGIGFIFYLLLTDRPGLRDKFPSVYVNRKLITTSLLCMLLILLISHPPSFTLGGINVYTPSYLLYFVLPVFRILVRWSVVIFLLTLVVNSFLWVDIVRMVASGYKRWLAITLFLLLNLAMFSVRFHVLDLGNASSELVYLKDTMEEGGRKVVIYPNADHKEIFWALYHKGYIVNPKDYVNREADFDSNEFSGSLVTLEGINEMREKETDFLVLYKDRVSSSRLGEIAALNPQITDLESLRAFFSENFGPVVFESEKALVFAGRTM